MAKSESLDGTFEALRALLERHARRLVTVVDKAGDFQVASPTLKDRIGRPLFLAAVQKKKSGVSYHLIAVYAKPALLKGISPELRKRMQGKSCFTFTTIDKSQLKELGALTKAGLAAMKDLELPWIQK